MAVAKLLAKTTGAAATVVAAVWRAFFSSGIPTNVRLRLILLTPTVRRRRTETRAQLMSRLSDAEAMFGLDRIAFEVIDLAVRGRRLTLVPQPEMPALQCMLKVNCYFTASAGYEELIPRVIDHTGLIDGSLSLLDRSLTLAEITRRGVMESARDDPARFRAGPLTLSAVREGVSESIDWDVPGGRRIDDDPDRPSGFHPTVLRDRRSWTPSRSTLQEYRNTEATVLCWTVRSWYFVRPKGFLVRTR